MPAAPSRRQRGRRALWDIKIPFLLQVANQTVIAWGCLLSSACADRNIHSEGCVVSVVTWRLLAVRDVPQRVSGMRDRGLSEQCLVRASIWQAMFSQGMRSTVSALVTFGLNQRFSAFYICIDWVKTPPHLADALAEAPCEIPHFIILFFAMIHRGHARRRLLPPSGLILSLLLKYANMDHGGINTWLAANEEGINRHRILQEPFGDISMKMVGVALQRFVYLYIFKTKTNVGCRVHKCPSDPLSLT